MSGMLIGRYQLENLLKHKIGFTFLDLRSDPQSIPQSETHPMLERSVAIPSDKALDYIRGLNLPNHAPIVLICENGSKSVGVAQELEDNSYLNVFVIEGGLETLAKS